jgi:hypothetical protein
MAVLAVLAVRVCHGGDGYNRWSKPLRRLFSLLMTLLEALRDPNLFARHFRDPSWGPWKAFIAALFAEGTAPEADPALYRELTGRTEQPASAFTEAALIVGRRGGKSRVLALIAVYLACFRDYAPYLAPGEVATVAVLAADRSQARAIFRFAIGLLRAVPLLQPMIVRSDAEQIVLSNRVVMEGRHGDHEPVARPPGHR